jgi:long-subunit acyl-CoA synthetase (AMP-forming)
MASSPDPDQEQHDMEAATAVRPAPGMPGLQAATICEAFQQTAAAFADQPALRAADSDSVLSWGQYARRVRTIAAGLASLGVGHGDAVALLLSARPEFNLVDTAAAHLGAVPFSIYNTSPPGQIEYVVRNAGARVIVTEAAHLDTVLAVIDGGVTFDRVVLVDGEHPEAMTLQELERAGAPEFDFDAAWQAVTPDDALTLIYTSGTTGPPKGVELTHGNIMFQWRALAQLIPPVAGGRLMAYLPAAHIADRLISHYQAIVSGACTTSVGDLRAAVGALAEVRPTTWVAVPRIWEKLKAALEAQGITDPAGLPPERKAAVRAGLGLAETVHLLCGAAPIPVEVLEYFAALDMDVIEGWGMTETAGVGTINPPEAIRIGTVGRVLPGMEARLAPDGELLLRGGNVMRGYRNAPEQTREALDEDGWMHTGDVAVIDADGYVRIVDRKKELIINAAGKNMSPANIEARLKASSPLIGQACVIGDARPYNVALLVLDPDGAAAWAAAGGRTDASSATLAGDAEVLAALSAAVDDANRRLARVEQIKRFRLLPVDWLPDSDELTPTMKLKRRPITEKYSTEIEALYAP